MQEWDARELFGGACLLGLVGGIVAAISTGLFGWP